MQQSSVLVNYLLNYHFTFHSDAPHRRAAGRFALIALTGLLLNGAVMSALTQWLRIHYVLAQLTATALVFAWTFLGNARWSFARTAGPSPTPAEQAASRPRH